MIISQKQARMSIQLLILALFRVSFTYARSYEVFTTGNEACLLKDRVRNLVPFLPTNQWTQDYEYRCQMPLVWVPSPADQNPPDTYEPDQPKTGTGSNNPDVWQRERRKLWKAKMTKDSMKETQYLTLFSKKDKIPVFSAYQAKPFQTITNMNPGQAGNVVRDVDGDKPLENQRPVNRIDWEDAEPREDNPRNIDYRISEVYDRGHLFPWQYTTDGTQAQATMKLTNAVPQDSIFNQEQWKEAETLLKNTVVLDCQDNGYTPIIFTGAVPDYWGAEDKDNVKRQAENAKRENEMSDDNPNRIIEPVKIGFMRLIPELKGYRWLKPIEKFEMSSPQVTVPTHMWTAFICINTKSIPVNYLAYIGMNTQVGLIKWYNDKNTFENILNKMYRNNIQEPFLNIPDLPKNHVNNLQSLNEKLRETESAAVKYRMIFPEILSNSQAHFDNLKQMFPQVSSDTEQHGVTEVDWWDQEGISMNAVSMTLMEQRLEVLVKQMGIEWLMFHLRLQPETKKRKKRSTRNKKETTQRTHTKYLLTKMTDASPTSDISLSQCTFNETYAGGEEEHVVNYERNIFIKDRATTGSTLKVSLIRDGEETEMPEETSATTYINIVLSPRGG